MASTSIFFNGRAIASFSPPYSQQLRHSLRVSTAAAERVGISSTASFYEVLGIRTCATCQEIRSAYRKMARVLHPDVSVGTAADEFMRVHAAYATLFDPDKRVVYDSSLALVGGYSKVIGRSRTWETDQCW